MSHLTSLRKDLLPSGKDEFVQTCKLLRQTVDQDVQMICPNAYHWDETMANPYDLNLEGRFRNVRILNVRNLNYTYNLKHNMKCLVALKELYGCTFMAELDEVSNSASQIL